MTQAITLHAGLTNMPPGFARLRELLKLQLRARLQQRETRVWLQLLNSHPVFHDLVRAYPHLVHKIYRPYLSQALNCRQRVELLTGRPPAAGGQRVDRHRDDTCQPVGHLIG